MTVRVERTFDLGVSPENVWEFIADPEKRASAISVVADYERTGETSSIWHIKLPIPFLDTTVPVRTEDVERDPPRYVKFVGRSSALRVTGEHEIQETETGSKLINRFTVEGKVPGVERFFKKNLDNELDNLEAALREEATA
ncbi:SRPBCC family protein [Halorussus gelatinilyticus]|uniref:SRPBCC family protein n=1 Tax=Halorussus gelatinilyticus TaxID=2937524 RepID=A0A8U0IH61_9EURY|nr:SRPBCC family protein [Halorussus gelatinilyticus]UPW00198.1 SRPBCC family protein [Halorussus gelatinilyticus]